MNDIIIFNNFRKVDINVENVGKMALNWPDKIRVNILTCLEVNLELLSDTFIDERETCLENCNVTFSPAFFRRSKVFPCVTPSNVLPLTEISLSPL